MAAIRLLAKNNTSNYIVAEIHETLFRSACENLTFLWVPSHLGICYNERADEAAKEAVCKGLEIRYDLTLGEALCRICNIIWSEWEQEFRLLSEDKGKFFADNIVVLR
ncbi:PREDICTED: uncharacterized protein LOC108355546 [Rhagoletis zephyria]|uniref:uncharacterized protein LOC108355546 n=1 Tax=Rhagoletis zephyria TaxID=28612 RepID=UPI0008112262|nr:PREDICTED: uncharacterized protein LOC108355546 [Rhagoletis zephyria]